MSKPQDHYGVLGVKKSASKQEIKRAYRMLAKQHHPDRNPDNPSAVERFKEVQQAYGVLSDADKRAQYDQFGDAGVGDWSTKPTGEKVYEWGGGSTINAQDLEDLMSAFGGDGRGRHASAFDGIFDQFTGGGARRSSQPTRRRGRDQEYRIQLTFEQAIAGTTMTIQVLRAADGVPEALDVKIPHGVADGQKIRLKGKGHPGESGGPAGDLYLVCQVQPHAYFERRGHDIYLDVPMSPWEAALGARIDVPTLDGQATVTLPAGTSSGSRLRLKGRGIASIQGVRGDQYILINIVTPQELSEKERHFFEGLRDHESHNPREACVWWKEATQ